MQCNHEVYVPFSRTVTGRWIVPAVCQKCWGYKRGRPLGEAWRFFQKHFVLAGLTKGGSPVFHTSPSTKEVLSGSEALSSTEPLGAVLSFSSPWQGARPCRPYAHSVLWMYCCPWGMWYHTSAPKPIAGVRELTSRELPGKPNDVDLKWRWKTAEIWVHFWEYDSTHGVEMVPFSCGHHNICVKKGWEEEIGA